MKEALINCSKEALPLCIIDQHFLKKTIKSPQAKFFITLFAQKTQFQLIPYSIGNIMCPAYNSRAYNKYTSSHSHQAGQTRYLHQQQAMILCTRLITAYNSVIIRFAEQNTGFHPFSSFALWIV